MAVDVGKTKLLLNVPSIKFFGLAKASEDANNVVFLKSFNDTLHCPNVNTKSNNDF